MLIMGINGSEFINNPFTTITSVFTDLLGIGFFLIPISFIGFALYVKSRNLVTVSAYMIASGALFGSAALFTSYPEMSGVYYLFSGLGIAILVLSFYFSIRR